MTDLDLMRTLTQKGDRKIILLVMDGLGGLPREVGGSTELETAATPNLDRLAREGMVGLLHPVGVGISPGSGPGHLGLFGYDPEQYLIGRGVLEAVGIGLELTKQDVAARGNFCTVDDKGLITDRRAGRISTEECARMVGLIEDITLPPSPFPLPQGGEGVERTGAPEIEVIVKPVRDYRFVLILRGTELSAELNETDPQKTGVEPLKAKALDDSPEARHTADLVNKWVDQVRTRIGEQRPANMVTLRGWSREPGLASFEDVFKLKAAALAVYPMYKGLASLVGMTLIPGLNNLDGQIEALKREWDRYDFFFVHYKYTDSRGEDGDFDAKVKEIEKVDATIPQILELKPSVFVVTGDHSTPAVLRSHSWHPVPVLLWAPGTTRSNFEVNAFGETQCLKGALGQFKATHLMRLITAHALRQIKYGA